VIQVDCPENPQVSEGLEMKELERYLNWLKEQIQHSQYGEYGIKIAVHNGKITRIERLIVDKQKIAKNVEMKHGNA
jgi:hypothetical protein